MSRSLLSRLTSFLPHRKAAVPVTGGDIRLSVYLDTELGQARRHEWDVISRFVEAINEASLFFDVGANIGLYSVLALRWSGASVHAFEPDPRAAERIIENVELNNLSTRRIVQREVAIWETVGSITLSRREQSQSNSIVSTDDAMDTIDVSTTTLDAYCREEGIQPDVVKVDVEHAGAGVMAGASSTIDEVRPTWLLEVHDEDEGAAFRDALADYAIESVTDHHWFAQPD